MSLKTMINIIFSVVFIHRKASTLVFLLVVLRVFCKPTDVYKTQSRNMKTVSRDGKQSRACKHNGPKQYFPLTNQNFPPLETPHPKVLKLWRVLAPKTRAFFWVN